VGLTVGQTERKTSVLSQGLGGNAVRPAREKFEIRNHHSVDKDSLPLRSRSRAIFLRDSSYCRLAKCHVKRNCFKLPLFDSLASFVFTYSVYTNAIVDAINQTPFHSIANLFTGRIRRS